MRKKKGSFLRDNKNSKNAEAAVPDDVRGERRARRRRGSKGKVK